MAWVVDTCVLLDIHCADPHFAQSSADCLTQHLSDGLVISPITYVELAPAFAGNMKLQEQFLMEYHEVSVPCFLLSVPAFRTARPASVT